MKRIPFYILILCMVLGCSKSGSEEQQDTTMIAEMTDETDGNSEPEDELPELTGEFMDGAHPTSGLVTVNSERTSLFIKDFRSDDGPILELYVANDIQATEYTTLGELQGLEGDFTYELPGGIDFETENYVLVWCVAFSVSFGHAILE
ncbi:MAG: DM13 domain-containing protein [Eudoraea sp.]|nr:DM13 domain-containing protein [Eudoraea sp.]